MRKMVLAERKKSKRRKSEIGGRAMSDLMKVSSNPHIRSKDSTSRIMLAVIIALLPTTIFGIYNFGIRALLIVAITIASTVLTEFVFEK